jgi:glyoxylase-like metal-dependent hydrolase (beta-lactamase superfamily II)
MPIAYKAEQSVAYGVLTDVAPNVRRIVANNASPFTYHGTGTYVLGRGKVAVIDPGPALVPHVDALLSALAGEEITHVLITHTHNDHSPAARILKERLGVRTYGFGPHGEGKHGAGAEIEEGADRAFVPDERVKDGDRIACEGFDVECVYTPGHAQNHVCFGLPKERALFSGDHVMGWSTTVVSPPDGDMGDYLASLAKLLRRDDARLYPTHGTAIDDPKPFVQSLIDHRAQREQQILAELSAGPARIGEMVPRMYKDVPAYLHPAAARSVLAHVLHLYEREHVTTDDELGLSATYRLK